MKTKYEELAPWDTHLVEIDVGCSSPFVNKTLSESNIRLDYGINIVAIYHSAKSVLTPRGNEKIYLHDKLIVLGEDNQIDAFKKQIESKADTQILPPTLQNFILKAFLIEKGHRLIGKTIRDSKIREFVNGIVVGLERENIRTLNPDLDTILQENDLLLVVGEVAQLKRYPHI
jgi:monovalent cation:H+ antiporter-2, CPA2 family